MKSPTYIIRSVYQEQLIEKLLDRHKQKMQTILTKNLQSPQISQKQSEKVLNIQLDKIEKYRKQKESNRKFIEQQQFKHQQMSDKCLIKKMMETDSRGFTLEPIKQKSLVANYNKAQAYEIELENHRLINRIINQQAVISKDQHDKFFLKHQQLKVTASRLRTATSTKNKRPMTEQSKSTRTTEISIQFSMVVFNKELYNKENIKTEYLFSIEVLQNDTSLFTTIPNSFEYIQTLSIKLILNATQLEPFKQAPLILKVWKVKNNSQIYMGQTNYQYNETSKEMDIMKKVNDKEVWNGFIQLK